MGNNNLYKVENTLRSMAKRYKSVKYSLGLAILFLMMGVSAFSEEIVGQEAATQQEVMSNEQIASSKENLKGSIENLQSKIDNARKENEKGLAGLKLELTQLMEQGNQVVKSSWSSWQFGANYMYDKWNGAYKGRGDKAEKYPYEGVFVRDTNEFNRYVAPNSKSYGNLPTSSVPNSAATNKRNGLRGGYGLASTVLQPEPIVALELSAGITPRVVNKKSPDTSPAAPTITLPAFSPKLITPPVAPAAPIAPTITFPTFNVSAISYGNYGARMIDGNSDNSFIEEVAVTSGEFNVVREYDFAYPRPYAPNGHVDKFTYSYTGYSGVNAWGTGATNATTNPSHPGATVAQGGTWTNWSRTNGSRTGVRGVQMVVGDGNGTSAMLNNGNFLYTNLLYQNSNTGVLGEFAHLDVHRATPNTDALTGYQLAVANGGTPLPNGTDIINAYKDMLDNVNETTAQGGITNNTSDTHSWINSGRIVIEGGWSSLTNTYTHTGTSNIKQMAANTGEVIFQPYKDGNGTVADIYTAGYVVSNDVSGQAHSIMYNGATGKIKTYTRSHATFVSDPGASKPVSAVNRGTIQMYGENSAGVYLKRESRNNLLFNSSDFAFNLNDNAKTAGDFKPVEMYGDKSIGLYVVSPAGSIEGNFAADIGAVGVGNQKFTTANTSNKSAGTFLTDYNINPNSTTDDIESSFGIMSKLPINLTTHQIRIFDKATGNVGVFPIANVELKVGGGSIELNGGTTAKNNIGVYIGPSIPGGTSGEGAVTSTGSIKLDQGIGNLAIFAVGGNLPTGVTHNVSVREVKATNTKNSVLIYGSNGAKIKLSDGTGLPTTATYGLNVSGATVEADANSTNKKDTGAVFATGANTEITVDRIALPATANVNINGVKITDPGTDRYVGFGLMAENGGKVSAKKNYIKVTNGSTAVAAIGTNSVVDMSDGVVEYSGKGYALYAANGGNINMTNSKLILDGNAVGYEKVYGGTLPINTSGMTIHVKSNDVTIMNLVNATAPLNVSTLSTTLNSWVGLSAPPTHDPGAANYKMAAIDGLVAYNIDQNIDRKAVANGTGNANENMFVRNLAVQKGKVNLLSGNTVSATLNTTELNQLGVSTVVGLDMNSSSTSTSRNDTQINLKSGSKIISDRVDNGSGAVGVFINYGEANIDNGAVINVEKSGINAANQSAVGIFAVNGSKVDNKGEINVGGESSIGVLGLSFRTDSTGLKRYEFGGVSSPKPGEGSVEVVNNNKINLDGKKAVGIYVEDNDNKGIIHSVQATNEANGIITMSGESGIAMASKFGNLVNKGKINITADKGTGMFVETDNVRTADLINEASGTISIGNSTSESVLRTGMFTKNQNVKIVNKGTIDAGTNSYAIYGKDVLLASTSNLKVGDNGVGVFTTSTTPTTANIDIQAGAKFNIANQEAVGVFVGTDAASKITANGVVINDAGSNMTIGNNSYGYVIKGRGTSFTNSAAGTVNLDTKAVYLYSDDQTGVINNNVTLTSKGSVAGTDLKTATGGQNYGLYSAGTLTNNGNIDFSKGIGNVGIYSIKGGTATNYAPITIGDSNAGQSLYSIGMAAGYAKVDSGNIVNRGTINVNGRDSIGMYASGPNSTILNDVSGNIILRGDGSMGLYLDNGAKGVNKGTITTSGNPKGAVGIVVRNGAEFTNEGTVTVNSAGGYAFFKANGGIIKNYGTFHIGGGALKEYLPGSKPTGKYLEVNGVKVIDIDAPSGSPTATIKENGKLVTPVVTNVSGNRDMLTSNIGMYIDTLRGTNPLTGSLSLLGDEADLIIGVEASQVTTSKYIQVPQNIIAPYNATMAANPTIKNWNIYSGALTWISTATLNKTTGLINNIYLAKMPYTAFAGSDASPVAVSDTYNFLDGLEKRYGVEAIGTRENKVFQKLNGIGKNEEVLFYQATDEMMGHQYANVQQRVQATGDILDKEFNYLRSEWQTASKDSNKLKTFGTEGEYKTDTAGVIDYKYNAQGVAYVHENEDIKLGRGIGWYSGIVHSKLKFKDLGNSKEEQVQTKVGLYKSIPFDDNNSLNWTISGEVSVGYNKMHRRFLVVDEIFQAKSKYYNYGVGIKNEIGKEFRLSESFSLRPYAALGLEYGRVSKIREKSGEIKLEVKQNDFISVKPEVGAELGFKHYFGAKSVRVGLGAAYENELGKVANGKNKAKVADTSADWFNIRGEKEDRRGNVKFDLNLGLDNQRFGVTGNVGYDTKGENVRGGVGLRVIF